MSHKSVFLKLTSILLVLLLALGLAFAIALMSGSVPIRLPDLAALLFHSPGIDSESRQSMEIIIFQVRLPRLLLAAAVGAALAMAGTAFQGLLRNPLADPYIIGTSAGASFGAALSIVLGLGTIQGISPTPLLAFGGSLAAMVAVYRLAQRDGRLPVDTFLLAGVIVGAFISSLVSFLMVMAREDLPKIVYWLMGSFSGREDWNMLAVLLPYLATGSLVLYLHAYPLNLLTMGEEAASQKGLDVEKTKRIVMVAASLITAAAVSVSGLIGFVGLLIPHIMRMLTGPDHRVLIPASAVAGAVFLVLTDTLARTLFLPEEMPVGVITALCGAPFFFWLLRRRRNYL